MGFLDFLFGNKKEIDLIERERQAKQIRLQLEKEKKIAEEREKRLAENRRKEGERLASLNAKEKTGKSETFTIISNGKNLIFDPDSLKIDQEALNAYERHDYSTAISKYTMLIEKNSNAFQYYKFRGTVYEDIGNDSLAFKDFAKAVELCPTDAVALYRLAMVYYRNNDMGNAIKYLEMAYKNHPTYDNLMGDIFNNILFVHKRVIACNLGNLLTQYNRVEEGLKLLDEVISNCPDYAYPYYVKGLNLAMGKNYPEALIYLGKAQELGYEQATLAIKQIYSLTPQTNSGKDKYETMVNDATYNPFCITTDPSANPETGLPDFRNVFKRELLQHLNSPYASMMGGKGIIGGYVINMIDSYYKNAGFVPKICVDQIMEQVYDSIQDTQYSYLLDSLEELKEGIYPQLFTKN